jgi:hypothetical protein
MSERIDLSAHEAIACAKNERTRGGPACDCIAARAQCRYKPVIGAGFEEVNPLAATEAVGNSAGLQVNGNQQDSYLRLFANDIRRETDLSLDESCLVHT